MGNPHGGLTFTKRIATGLAILAGIIWMYRRIEQGRRAERNRPRLRDANGNLLPPNIALNQHQPSPLPQSSAASSSSSSSSTDDVRLLSSHDRYLSPIGSKIRRQSVCLTLEVNGHILQPSTTEPNTFTFNREIVPILQKLATYTTLHLICVEADKDKQAGILSSLNSIGLPLHGFLTHRLLFCSTLKGKQAILRHIEPNLVLDQDRAMLQLLKPFIDQVIQIEPNGANNPKLDIPTFSSIPQFFDYKAN